MSCFIAGCQNPEGSEGPIKIVVNDGDGVIEVPSCDPHAITALLIVARGAQQEAAVSAEPTKPAPPASFPDGNTGIVDAPEVSLPTAGGDMSSPMSARP